MQYGGINDCNQILKSDPLKKQYNVTSFDLLSTFFPSFHIFPLGTSFFFYMLNY